MKRSYNVCVAGATGFVGKNFIDYLTNLSDTPRITCLVRPSSNTEFLRQYPVEIKTVDFHDQEALKHAVRNCDYLYNLIGMTAAPTEEQLQIANYNISEKFLNAYLHHKHTIKGYFFMSTLAVAGPKDFGQHDPVRAKHLHPLTAYGRTKLNGEQLHWPYIFDNQLNISVLRAPGIYGRWDQDIRQFFDLVKKGITPILGSGETRLTLINIHDLVRFMHKITISQEQRGIFYVYDGRHYQMKELGSIARQILRPGSVPLKIPAFMVRSAASVNQFVNPKAIFNKEKCKEILAKDWAYEANDFSKSGEQITYHLENGIHDLFYSERD